MSADCVEPRIRQERMVFVMLEAGERAEAQFRKSGKQGVHKVQDTMMVDPKGRNARPVLGGSLASRVRPRPFLWCPHLDLAPINHDLTVLIRVQSCASQVRKTSTIPSHRSRYSFTVNN